MRRARLVKLDGVATQSGGGRGKWELEFVSGGDRRRDPLTGWTSSGDTLGQVKMRFMKKEDAEGWADRYGVELEVEEREEEGFEGRDYADNFSALRRGRWTH